MKNLKKYRSKRLFFLSIFADKFDGMKRLFKIVTIAFAFESALISNLFADTIHIVKKGETLYSISRLYGVSVETVQKANNLSSNNVRVEQKLTIPDADSDNANISSTKNEVVTSENVEKSESHNHIVQRGETLYSISRLYDKSVELLKSVNGLSGNNVMVGQKIVIPADDVQINDVATVSDSVNEEKSDKKDEKKRTSKKDIYYTVENGDTWLGIARDHGLSLTELQRLNNANENTMLKIGQRIKVEKVPDIDDPHVYDSKKKGDTSLVWPVKATTVSYVTGKVNGVRLSSRKNETVKSIASGTVTFSGAFRGFGNVVLIQAPSGLLYSYTHLGKVKVSKGDSIKSGMEIGSAGIDIFSQQPCVYFMVYKDNKNIDPAKAPRG